jgi:hypothetical protein
MKSRIFKEAMDMWIALLLNRCFSSSYVAVVYKDMFYLENHKIKI